jgi:alpha-tubulin suppressor-like RCC1 family protein
MGEAYCWGRNAEGQLGDGTATTRATPTLVAGGIAWSSINAGTYDTCGIAITGDAYCWGANSTGSLGDGTLDRQHLTPSLVQGGLHFKSIAANGASTCALAQSGTPYCWGRLDYSIDGGASVSTVPIPLPGDLLMASLDGAIARVCGLTTSNRAVCWTSALAPPVEVPGQP